MMLMFKAVSLLAIIVGVASAADKAANPSKPVHHLLKAKPLTRGAPTPTEAPAPAPPQSCNVPIPTYVGDGYCDGAPYNTADCDWDGGDCCAETCTNGDYTCGVAGYNCLDPSVESQDCNVPNPSWIGDGYCDAAPYNTEACGWDGGDCCECTCTDGAYTCGYVGYNCLDPNAGVPPNCDGPIQSCELADFAGLCSAIAPDMVPACIYMAAVESQDCDVPYPDYIGDGYCDGAAPYNTAACNWDGGDCCPGTCTDGAYTCGYVGYNCLDPTQS